MDMSSIVIVENNSTIMLGKDLNTINYAIMNAYDWNSEIVNDVQEMLNATLKAIECCAGIELQFCIAYNPKCAVWQDEYYASYGPILKVLSTLDGILTKALGLPLYCAYHHYDVEKAQITCEIFLSFAPRSFYTNKLDGWFRTNHTDCHGQLNKPIIVHKYNTKYVLRLLPLMNETDPCVIHTRRRTRRGYFCIPTCVHATNSYTKEVKLIVWKTAICFESLLHMYL